MEARRSFLRRCASVPKVNGAINVHRWAASAGAVRTSTRAGA